METEETECRISSVSPGGGLFVDFLDHEMLVPAFFGSLGVPGDLDRIVDDFVSVQIVEGDRTRTQPGNLEIADIVHLTGVFQNRRDVGSQEAFAVGDADDHGAVLPGGEDLAGEVFEHQGQRIGAPHADHGSGDGIDRAELIFFIVIVDQLDDDFGIRLGIEAVVVAKQLGFQLDIVFDDAVVDADHVGFDRPGAGACAVPADMRVRVGLAGLAMGRPAGMPDAAGSDKGIAVIRFDRKVSQLAGRFDHLGQTGSVPDSQSGGVIAAVFQTGKPVQQNRRRLGPAGKTDDSAHNDHLPGERLQLFIIAQLSPGFNSELQGQTASPGRRAPHFEKL